MRWVSLAAMGVCLVLVRCGEESEDSARPDATGGSGGGSGSGQSGGGSGEPGAAGSGVGGGAADAGTDSSTGGSEADAGADSSTGGGEADAASEAASVGAHCAPATLHADFIAPGSILSFCGLTGIEQELPNGAVTGVDSVPLPEPLVAGALTALSMDVAGSGPINIELWGTDSECGVAQELLWWAPVEERILCAEFTPTAAYRHLIVAYRSVDNTTRRVQVNSMTLCRDGRCSEPADGTGLQPGDSLVAPLGAYPVAGNSLYFGYEWRVVSAGGRMVIELDRNVDDGVAAPVRQGVFRMPPTDPFGDGWYCIGADSTYTRLDNGERYTFSFHNLTRLAGCDAPAGTDMAALSISAEVSLASSLVELSGVSLGSSRGDCDGMQCRFLLTDPPQFNWLELLTDEDVGDQWTPTLQTASLREGAWIMRPNDTDPFQVSCAHGGTVYYDPEGTSEVELEPMTAFESCPGEPVQPDVFEGTLY